MLNILTKALCGLLLALLARPTLSRPIQPRTTYTVSPVYTFSKGTWVENLAVRSNGLVLITLLTTPEVWQVDPVSKTGSLIHKFADATGCLGITETVEDEFYVACGNYSTETFEATAGSWAVWKLDFTTKTAEATRIAQLPDAGFLNGAMALSDSVILIADSAYGAVWSLNTATGSVQKSISDPSMLPTHTVAPIGINGLHIQGQDLLYTQTNNATLWSIPIDISTGAATGPTKVVSANVTGDDDFTADGKGNLFIASDGGLRSLGKGSSVAGTIATVDGASAVHFGRGEGDGDVLYVSSTGGIECYIGGDCPSAGGLYMVSM